MKTSLILFWAGLGLAFFQSAPCLAQENPAVHWVAFEALDDSLALHPKKVFVDFYTDWCTYCRKMDRVVFTNPEVAQLLNEEYYAVRFDAETESPVTFGGHTFTNDQTGISRKPVHQIAQLLASREGEFAPPALIILDEEFNVSARYFEYLDSQRLLEALQP
ncbi:MAG: thioredoxin family protein [Bacteroidota bacterium]